MEHLYICVEDNGPSQKIKHNGPSLHSSFEFWIGFWNLLSFNHQLFISYLLGKNMSGRILRKPISAIAVGQSKWKVNVVVLDKTDIRTNGKGRRTQKVLLQDKEGTIIEMILWNQQIDLLQSMFIPTRTYEVAGAKVQEISPNYIHMSPGQSLEWIMIQSASVEPITDASEVIPYPPMQVTSLSQLSALVGCKTPVDIVAVVVAMHGPREARTETKSTPLQEIVVIDKSLTPKTLTMWGHFLTHQALDIADNLRNYPVIVCRRLVINNYADGSLSTTPFCYMSLNSNIPEAKDMRTWFNENKNMIMEFATPGQSSQKDASDEVIEGPTSQIASLQADNTNALRIEGKMSIVDLQQDINYCECETCFRSIMKEANEKFTCRTCNASKIAIPKCKVLVKLDGDTGNVFATMYDENAVKLLGLKAEKTHEMQRQDIENLLVQANEKLQSKKVTAIVKAATKVYADQKPRYNIQQWTEAEQITEKSVPEKRTARQLIDTPEKNDPKRLRSVKNMVTAKEGTQTAQGSMTTADPTTLRRIKMEHGSSK